MAARPLTDAARAQGAVLADGCAGAVAWGQPFHDWAQPPLPPVEPPAPPPQPPSAVTTPSASPTTRMAAPAAPIARDCCAVRATGAGPDVGTAAVAIVSGRSLSTRPRRTAYTTSRMMPAAMAIAAR